MRSSYKIYFFRVLDLLQNAGYGLGEILFQDFGGYRFPFFEGLFKKLF